MNHSMLISALFAVPVAARGPAGPQGATGSRGNDASKGE